MIDSAPQISRASEEKDRTNYRQLTIMFLTVHVFLYGLLALLAFLERDKTMFIVTAALTVAAVLASLVVFMLPKRFLNDPIPRTLDQMLHFPN